MALAPCLHRSVDALAMWSEDRVARPPDPYRPGPEGPPACFGPLPPPPPGPNGPGPWRFPASAWGGPAGDQVVVEVEPARGLRRGTAILVPPWKLGWRAPLRGWRGLLAGAGLEVWTLALPHHRGRAAPGARPGEGFVTNDLGRLRAALEETVREIRTLTAAAAPRGPVGLVGLSLGGLCGALAATGPERLAFAALVAPPGDLAALLVQTPVGRRYARLAERGGAPLPPPEALRRQLGPLWPGARPPTAARLLLAAGRHDAVVGSDGLLALAEAWGLAAHRYPRGHLTLLFACRALRRDVARLAREATS
jgi:hypothetical protein